MAQLSRRFSVIDLPYPMALHENSPACALLFEPGAKLLELWEIFLKTGVKK